ELFLLPDWLPVQPNNFYCHTRYIYLAISYLYGKRFRADLGALTDELRADLYDRNYREIDFSKYRHEIAASDLFVRPSAPLRRAGPLRKAPARLAAKNGAGKMLRAHPLRDRGQPRAGDLAGQRPSQLSGAVLRRSAPSRLAGRARRDGEVEVAGRGGRHSLL